MKNKVINIKFAMIFILVILFIFVLNYNETFARTISFDLKDGTISIIKDNIEEEKPDNEDNENEEKPDEEKPNEDEEIEDETGIVEEGAYIISCAADDRYVLDIEGKSLENTANLHIWTKTEEANQRFYIEQEEDGYYKISSINSGKVLDVANASKDSGTNIWQYESNDSAAQKWEIRLNQDGTYTFVSKVSGKAIDVKNAEYKDGTDVYQYDLNNTKAQKFKLEKTGIIKDDIVAIKKLSAPKMLLDIKDNSPEDKTKLQLYSDNGTLAQRFEIHTIAENEVRIRTASSGGWLTETGKIEGAEVIQLGNSSTPVNDANTWIVEWNNGITFKNKESNLFLDVSGDATENETKIQVWKENNSQLAQRFLVNEENLITNGWYIIENSSGKVMDLDNSGKSNGTNIQLWGNGNQSNQKFKIEKTAQGYGIYTIHNLPLDVEQGSLEDGANIRQWEDNGTGAQRWIPEIRDGGYIAFKNYNSGKYIDVENQNAVEGANILQASESNSNTQLWRLTSTILGGWVNRDGNWYCYDPQTGELVKNCTRVDPTMTDPAQYGSIYDFDSEGRATWHLPVESDLAGGTGPSAPIPTVTGDRRQRVIQMALSRIGCPYQNGRAPTGFVCDGLTAWSYTTALGDWFYTGPGSREDLQDASWQWEKIETRNGIKYDTSQLRSGDFVFFGNSQVTQAPGAIDYNGEAYHAGIYYKDDIMINSRGEGGVGYYSVSGYYMKWLGGGSPYEAETSKVEIHK